VSKGILYVELNTVDYYGKKTITQRHFAQLFGVDLETVGRWMRNGNIAVDDRKQPWRIILDALPTLQFLFNRRGRIDSKVIPEEKEKESTR